MAWCGVRMCVLRLCMRPRYIRDSMNSFVWYGTVRHSAADLTTSISKSCTATKFKMPARSPNLFINFSPPPPPPPLPSTISPLVHTRGICSGC